MPENELTSQAVEKLPAEIAPENAQQERDRQTIVASIGAIIVFLVIWFVSGALESARLVSVIPIVMSGVIVTLSLIGLVVKPSLYGVLVAVLLAAEFLLLGPLFIDWGSAREDIDGPKQVILQILAGSLYGVLVWRVFVTPKPERSGLYSLLWVVASLLIGLVALFIPFAWAGLRAFTDGAHQ